MLAALDGFHGSVVQRLRPWAPKAPQLPSGSRTAVEEADIDVEPPALDLEEEASLDLQLPPAQTPAEPEVIVTAVAAALTNRDDAAVPASSGIEDESEAIELISWDSAQERLEHERSVYPETGADSRALNQLATYQPP